MKRRVGAAPRALLVAIAALLALGLALHFESMLLFVSLVAVGAAAYGLRALRRARRRAGRWRRPRRYHYNLVVIGGASDGLIAARAAATAQARVALVEPVGTRAPHAAPIRAARLRAEFTGGHGSGAPATLDFATVMERVRTTLGAAAPLDRAAPAANDGVDAIEGRVRLVSPWIVEVDGPTGQRRLTTRSIVIAVGARPRVPALPGLEDADWYTSETIWQLSALPRRLLVLGGGAVGCELGQTFARLGSSVTVVERGARLLATEDEDVAHAISTRFAAEGICVLTECAALRIERNAEQQRLVARYGAVDITLTFDALLIAIGRTPEVAGLGLEALGLEFGDDGTLPVDRFLRTPLPNVYACGAAIGGVHYAHVAAHEARRAVAHALFGRCRRRARDAAATPRAVFTDPEIAAVGLDETQARARGVPVEVTRYALIESESAQVDGATSGFVKLVSAAGSDRLLGATVVANGAAEAIAELTLAVRHRIGLRRVLATPYLQTGSAAVVRAAAEAWERARPAPGLRAFLTWRRGGQGSGGLFASLAELLAQRARPQRRR